MHVMTFNLPRIFVVLTAFFGLLLAFILPPTQAPDEESHLIRSVMVARGDLNVREQGGVFGQDVPESLVAYTESHRGMVFRNDVKYPYARWYADSHKLATYEPTVFKPYSAQDASPLLYIPQAGGVLMAQAIAGLVPMRSLGFSWAAAQYGSRMGNLAMFLIVGCASLAFIQRYRLVLFAAMTLPMVIQQAASSSYDTTTLAAAFGFFALLTGLLERSRGPKGFEIALLLLCAFFLGHAKAAYAPVLVGAILLHRVMPLRHFLTLLGSMFLFTLGGLIVTVGVLGVPDDPNLIVKYSAQLDWLAAHPTSIPALILRSLNHNQDFLTISFLANFGWLDTNWALPALVLPGLALVLALAADASQGKGLFQISGSVLFFLGFALSVAAFHLALYIYWTSIIHEDGVGRAIIDGVQGRYFLPLTPYFLAPLAVMPTFIAKRVSGARADLALGSVVFTATSLALMIIIVLIRYWVPNPA